MKEKRRKITNILLYGSLVLVIAFTLITSIVVNYKKKQLADFNDKNQEIDKVLGDETEDLVDSQENERFSKNLLNFIDI